MMDRKGFEESQQQFKEMDGTLMQLERESCKSMVNENGEQKGIRSILKERGLWRDKMKSEEAKELLSEQPDFKESRDSWITETISPTCHSFIFFPKFHPEFNFIERYWGQAKRYARANCNYSFKELKDCSSQSFSSIQLSTIRKMYHHSFSIYESI